MPDQTVASPDDCAFQIEPFLAQLTGSMSIQVLDLDNQQPTTVVDCDTGASVKVHWDIEGHLKKHLCGKWCVCVHLESLGPGPELSVKNPCESIDWEPCNEGGWNYEVVIPHDITTPQDNNTNGVDDKDELCDPNQCGLLYQIGVTLTSKNGCGGPGHIAAYCKGPCIMFYKGES